VLKKLKYFEKTLSKNAIYNTYLRSLDASPLFAQYAWLQLSAFDLTELGMGLLHSILPVDFQPYAIDFTYVTPTPSETLQGIWAKFEPVDFSKLYTWMADFREYVLENFKEEFQPEVLIGVLPKAIYGVTPYGRGVYDPVVAREFLRATFWKLRLIRTPDISWQKTMDEVADYIHMVGVTDEHVFNRLMMIFSAQMFSFTLGLSLLGRSRLTETVEGWGVVPIKTAKGEIRDLYFKTLDQLQMGFILGVTPLGYGLLLPEKSIYKQPEGKKNPSVIKVMVEKIKGIISRLTYVTWAYCYDENTEVLTREGFKKFSELSYNDEIATLNPETDEIEYQHPIAIHKFNYKGKMVHIKGRSIDLLVTPEHKLYCANFFKERRGKNEGFKFIEAVSLLQSYRYQKYNFKRTAKWKGVNIEYFELPAYEKNWITHGTHRVFKEDKKLIPIADWLKLFAWYIAEGDTSTYGKVRIANTDEKNLQEILELCKKMGFNASIYKNTNRGYEKAGVTIYSVQLWKYLSQFGKATEKFIPNWIKMLSPDKLQIFLETITKGDGHKDSRNWKYYTSSRRLADDIQEIAIKAGYVASVGEIVDIRFSKGMHRYIVHIDRKRKDTTLTKKPELIDYDGFVYDVTVPKHHIILVRRNGKICWSSNSNYNKPEEMLDPHKSEKTTQYHELLSQRQFVENWVAKQIPPDEANPVRIRQYQNAVLQAVAWRAKRHKWGYNAWKYMSEDEFKGWWIKNWVGQGLNETTLKSLYEGAQIWLKRLREEKLSSGLKVKQRRISLALST